MSEYKVGDSIYYIQGYWNDATLQSEKRIKRTCIESIIGENLIGVNNGLILSPADICKNQEQAEARLKELKGE